MMLVVSFASYLTELHWLPKAARFLPEALSAVIGIQVVLAGTAQRFSGVAPKYWLIFGAMAVMIVCGMIANGVGSGPEIGGLRYY
ncbi:MAG: hypothetical protein ACRETD_01085, partial [Steroidobacteraceae bacterium]